MMKVCVCVRARACGLDSFSETDSNGCTVWRILMQMMRQTIEGNETEERNRERGRERKRERQSTGLWYTKVVSNTSQIFDMCKISNMHDILLAVINVRLDVIAPQFQGAGHELR